MLLDGSARLALAIAIACGAAFGINAIAGGALAPLLALGAGAWIIFLLHDRRGHRDQAVVAQITDQTMALDALLDPVIRLQETRVDEANSAAITLFGQHIVGQDIRLAIRHPSVTVLLSDLKATGMVEAVTFGNPNQIWEIRVTTTDTLGRLIQLVDRSARHAAERARVDFVANASHELRTPLATIIGSIETLSDADAGGDAETRNRFLELMGAQARRMDSLVADLMSLSRIEAVKHQPPEDLVDLAELVKRVAKERTRSFVMNIASDLPMICGDAAQLSQLLHNLIDNGEKYGPAGKEVTVSLTAEAGRVSLSILDEGGAISAEHIPRLTERFYRIDAGRSQAVGGTGLGLSIVKHIAEHHRGIVQIASDPEMGTTVTISFPANVTNMSSN